MGFTRRLFILDNGCNPSHGSTMGYVSDPFRIEEPALRRAYDFNMPTLFA